MDRKLVRAGLNLRVAFMKEILLTDNFMVRASITLGSRGKFMKEISLIITWKAKVS